MPVWKPCLSLLLLSCLLVPSVVFGVMSSTHYTIFADDINSGLVFSTGTYRLEGTTGESPVGSASSSAYQIIAGYQAMDRGQLSLTISNTSLNLGELKVSEVKTANATVSVSTDSNTGYTLSISGATWTSAKNLANLSGDTVDAGSEEYGFSISGVDVNSSLLSKDNIVSPIILMSSTTPVVASQSILTLKASIGASTSAGQRSQNITLTVSNNL